MSQIEISCIGSEAIFTNTPNIFSGGNVDSVKFKFDKDWDGFTGKTAVFYTNPKETALQILDSNNVAKIPSEMIANKGKLSIGVIGTKGTDDVKTSKILTYIVGKGAVTDDMETTAPTPNIWLQLLSTVEHNRQIVDNMELVVDESQMTNKANKDLSNVTNSTLKNRNIAQFKTGSYVGDGNGGVDYPNTLTFDFEPIFVMVYDQEGINVDGGDYSKLLGVYYTKGQIRQRTYSSSSAEYIYYNATGNSFSWHHSGNNAVKQRNGSGITYYYVAIG